MGRNAGWLAAASSLASYYGAGPDFIFLPEVCFDINEFLDVVVKHYNSTENTIVVVSEGIRKKSGIKTCAVEISLLQRCVAHLASKTDYDEAYMAGCEAVKAALNGITDKMVGFECTRGENYTCKHKFINLEDVANYESLIPSSWIIDNYRGMTVDYIKYLLPLIQGDTEMIKIDSLPRFAKLKKIIAK